MEASNRVSDDINNIRLKDPHASYRSHVWKYSGFKIVNIHSTYEVPYYIKSNRIVSKIYDMYRIVRKALHRYSGN
jgi:hypothetical protein